MPTFIPRQRKHRVLEREKKNTTSTSHPHPLPTAGDSNTFEVLPSAQHDREDRKRKVREELRAQQPKMSAKKQKRLDKYVETKMRKEETTALIKKLEGRHKGVESGGLESARTFGRRREGDGRGGGGGRENGVEHSEDNGEEEEEEQEEQEEEADDKERPVVERRAKIMELLVTAVKATSTTTAPVSFGGGLKRPLDLDEEGKPIIPTRKRIKAKSRKTDFVPQPAHDSNELEWGGVSEEEGPDYFGEDDDGVDISSNGSDAESEVDTIDGSDEASSQSKSETSEDDESSRTARKERSSAFKSWAEQKKNETIGFQPSTVLGDAQASLPLISESVKKSFEPRPLEQDPLPEGFVQESAIGKERKAYAVSVERTEEIQTARLLLPVLAEEQRIMEAVFNNDVIIVAGATGSGKTTQVPQFLFEHGFGDASGPTPGMIGVTQPRRVAAVSMAKRVSVELGNVGKRVGHQIRFDATVGKQTAIKFMTDGVLLRELSDDFSLRKYSAIVIDEAHERTVNTDILIAMMSRCINIRRQLAKESPKTYTPLKLVIMSATLREEDFRNNARLFATPPPVVQAEGRQYEVSPHWSRRTSYDYLEEAFKKVSSGHRKLPPGGMLVFLTGQNEIRTLMKRMKEAFPATSKSYEHHAQIRVSAAEMPVEAEDMEVFVGQNEEIDDIDEHKDDDMVAESEDPDAEFVIEGEDAASEVAKIHVLPLYSQLPSKEQLKVFETPPDGSRLIVLATNVAETSLTIPGIRYVFDSGRHKEREWNRAGVQTFRTTWISKASANQRMGRAGRTGPGHCYRLYSSAIYESAMQEHSQPEIHRSPLESVVLQLKSMNIARVDNFPFPTPPKREDLIKAERLLKNLGALDGKGRITKVGKELQNYPLNPRFAMMMRLGIMHGVAREMVTVVAALDVVEVIVPENQLDLKTPEKSEDERWTEADSQAETLRERRRQAYNIAMAKFLRMDFSKEKIRPQADAMRLFAAVMDYSNIPAKDTESWCRDNFVREKGMKEAEQLREQLSSIVRNVSLTALPGHFERNLKTPSSKTVALLKQIIAKGFLDQIAIRADLLPTAIAGSKPKRAIEVRYKTLFPSTSSADPDEEEQLDPYVYIHPSSILSRLPPTQCPRYIVYSGLQRSQPSVTGRTPKVRMHALTPVSAEQIASIARDTGLLEIGKPLGKVGVGPGEDGLERREVDVMLSLVGEAGTLAWPLRRQRVVQKRVVGEGWVVEKWLDS